MIVNGTVAIWIPTQQQERKGNAVRRNQIARVGQTSTARDSCGCGRCGGTTAARKIGGIDKRCRRSRLCCGPQRASLSPRWSPSRNIQTTARERVRVSSVHLHTVFVSQKAASVKFGFDSTESFSMKERTDTAGGRDPVVNQREYDIVDGTITSAESREQTAPTRSC
jgi:hypothetical protein